MKASALVASALLVVLSGCGSMTGEKSGPQIIDTGNVQRLYQREWDLKGLTVDGRQVVMDVAGRTTISFGPDGQVAGFGGVNRFKGTYAVSAGGVLSWASPALPMSRNAGPPELMEKERAFFEGLRKSNVAILEKHTLILQSDDSSTVLTFEEAGY
ncbi:MAG TPA: META domain-containing protein [Burkholderiales bacterium]|nr:META domain-containing protein [Burkholderiales bacterium]